MSTFEFSTRPVGIELEIPESSEDLLLLAEEFAWDVKEDGSIPEEGSEFVTPPIRGSKIPRQIKRFYDVCHDTRVNTEHSTCGTHVHVNAMDIYAYLNEHSESPDLETRVETWGMALSCLTRLFVGPGRNGTRFARGGFAIRDSYDCDPGSLKKSRREEYPTIAIRENTFEFRIFPSTTRGDFTLARIALCQAAGDWLFKNLQVPHDTFMENMSKLEAPLKETAVWDTPALLDDALNELGIKGTYHDILMSIFNRFKDGNLHTLPAIWLRERDLVRQQIVLRAKALEALAHTFDQCSVPDSLRGYLRGNFGAVIATI